MPESSLPKPGGGRLAKYAAGKVAEKAAAVREEIRDELPVKPGGGRLAKYAAERVAEEAAAARVEIVTTAAHRAQMAGLRALNVALAAATPLLRHKFSAFLLRASADGRAVAQIYPKPLSKKELKASNQPPPPPLYTLRVRRLNYATDAAIRTLALKLRRRRSGQGHQLRTEKMAQRARAASGALRDRFRQRFGHKAEAADAAAAAEAEAASDDDHDDEELAPGAVDPEAMPEALRPVASRVVAADVSVELALAFNDGCDFEFVAYGEQPCLPTLGGVVVRYLTVHAVARIWWDVVGGVALLAFLHDHPPEVEWEVETRLCCLKLPDWAEDRLAPKLAAEVLSRFTVENPLELKVGAKQRAEMEAELEAVERVGM